MKLMRFLLVALAASLTVISCNLFAPSATQPPPTVDGGTNVEWQGITFIFPASLGNQWLGKTVPADDPNSGAPENWLVAAHEEITFSAYPVKNQYQTPRILVFAVSAWQNYNPEAGKRISALKQLLKDKPTTFGPQEGIPVLPVFNAGQIFRVHVSYLNFQNGSGVRFITQYDQAVIPINNSELFYCFQGLTTDGNYYVAAFFPISHSSLPADMSNAAQVIGADFVSYLDKTVKALEAAADDSFNPTVGTLDKVLQSLKVK